MSKEDTQQTEKSEPKHQMILYHICSWDFESENIYAIGGIRPNARYIAHQYGCELEFRESHYEQVGNMTFLDVR